MKPPSTTSPAKPSTDSLVFETEILYEASSSTVAGAYLSPDEPASGVAALIVGGTLSNLSDGDLNDGGRTGRNALQRLAARLAQAGIPSLRYDKPGHGGSLPKPAWKGLYENEADAVIAGMEKLSSLAVGRRLLIIGESAGAYTACLAARRGFQADGYIFLGAFCGLPIELYEYNFGRFAEWASQDEEKLKWAKGYAPGSYALGKCYSSMFEAVMRGDDIFEADVEGIKVRQHLHRRREEMEHLPTEMFRSITARSLFLAGENDMNVPPDHARIAAQIVRHEGNPNAFEKIIRGVDHSFQRSPDDNDQKMRERHDFSSFRRPYSDELYSQITKWSRNNFG